MLTGAACSDESDAPQGPVGDPPPGQGIDEGDGVEQGQDAEAEAEREAQDAREAANDAFGRDTVPEAYVYPYQVCLDPLASDAESVGGAQVCTHVAMNGCVPEGLIFEEYASCLPVRTQRPFYFSPPDSIAADDDPRLQDADYMGEVEWAKSQVLACGCVCCHSSGSTGDGSSAWDIDAGPIWTDSLDDRSVAMFAGAMSSYALGWYPADDNNGFSRDVAGVPTTDPGRMTEFFQAELERRGVTQADIDGFTPIGNYFIILENEQTRPCREGEGMDAEGRLQWGRRDARYVYVMDNVDGLNPGVPPNRDMPDGVTWRIDVPFDSDPIASGLKYGEVPANAQQRMPAEGIEAPALVSGQAYKLYVLQDMGLPALNCSFTAP